MKDVFYLSLVQFFYDLLTRTQKYIKPPPKLHDTDHAPNVADIVTRFIDLITKAKQEQLLDSNQKVITVNGNLPNNKFQVFISNLTLEDLYNNDYHIYKATKMFLRELLKLILLQADNCFKALEENFRAFIAR